MSSRCPERSKVVGLHCTPKATRRAAAARPWKGAFWPPQQVCCPPLMNDLMMMMMTAAVDEVGVIDVERGHREVTFLRLFKRGQVAVAINICVRNFVTPRAKEGKKKQRLYELLRYVTRRKEGRRESRMRLRPRITSSSILASSS